MWPSGVATGYSLPIYSLFVIRQFWRATLGEIAYTRQPSEGLQRYKKYFHDSDSERC